MTRPATLEIRDLHVRFPVRGADGRRRSLHAVDGVSLTVRPGRTLGLVGESGCGKSSLVRAVLGLERAHAGEVTLGSAPVLGLQGARRRALASRLQIVFQDPFSALDPRMRVHDIVAEPLRIHRCYTPARVAELLRQVGLPAEAATRRPAEFSGGQRQRIGVARALALQPEVLVLDEPMSALDVSVQAQVINLLCGLQRELGLGYLLIAHDLSVVRHMCHDLAVMYLGRLVERGSAEAVLTGPAHPYTQGLIAAAPAERYGRPASVRAALRGEAPDPLARPSGCVFRTRCPRARPRCAADAPVLAAWADADHAVACWYPGPPDGPGA